MTRNEQIEEVKLEQEKLKAKVSKTKLKIPKFLIGFLFFVALFVYFFEVKLYMYFGTAIDFVKFMIGFYILISIICVAYWISKIRKIEKQLKQLSIKMYSLMKLENSLESE